MDPQLHRGEMSVADAYRLFSEREARGVSGVFEEWARGVSQDATVQAAIESLPPPKRQPNLVFAAARLHGAGLTFDGFRSTLLDRWDHVRATILTHATQTNEAARCAVVLPFLAELPGPVALLEVGASAGLCLQLDRYSYRYDDGTSIDPAGGPSTVVVPCHLGPGITAPTRVPEIVWQAGIDLDPVDVTDPDACTWLETLVWPEQEDRRERLRAALDIARGDPPRVERGDLLELLPRLAAQAPPDATLVVLDVAVLGYLSVEDRSRFVHIVSGLPGHWISCEGQGTLDLEGSAGLRTVDDRRFLLALDGVPRAFTDPHGASVEALDGR